MKKYVKPQIETGKFEVEDIISASNIFEDIADLDKFKIDNFNDVIAKENW